MLVLEIFDVGCVLFGSICSVTLSDSRSSVLLAAILSTYSPFKTQGMDQ